MPDDWDVLLVSPAPEEVGPVILGKGGPTPRIHSLLNKGFRSTLVRKWKHLPEDGWIFLRWDRFVESLVADQTREGDVSAGHHAARACCSAMYSM